MARRFDVVVASLSLPGAISSALRESRCASSRDECTCVALNVHSAGGAASSAAKAGSVRTTVRAQVRIRLCGIATAFLFLVDRYRRALDGPTCDSAYRNA